MVNKEEMKQEAIERMKILRLHNNVIREFGRKDRQLNKSENGGILYWLDESEQQKVKEFEEEYGFVVYHVIHHFAEFGECYCYLYVNSDETLWEEDRQGLEDGYVFAYVYNKDDDFCSEFGSIGIRPQFGGLVRTA